MGLMDLAIPSLSREDYRYCSLCFAESDVFIDDDEPSRFIHKLDGRVDLSLEDDSRQLTIGNWGC